MTLAMLSSATFALYCESTVSRIFYGVVFTRIECIDVDWQTELPPVDSGKVQYFSEES